MGPGANVAEDAAEVLLRVRLKCRVNQVIRVGVNTRDRALMAIGIARCGFEAENLARVFVLGANEFVELEHGAV